MSLNSWPVLRTPIVNVGTTGAQQELTDNLRFDNGELTAAFKNVPIRNCPCAVCVSTASVSSCVILLAIGVIGLRRFERSE